MTKNLIISLTESSQTNNGPAIITWVHTSWIRPHEEHSAERAEQIKENLKKTGVSLLISITSNGILLDGHHRFTAMKSLGFERIPVAMFDYKDSRLSTGSKVTKDIVSLAAVSGDLLPPKTTKHAFNIDGIDLPLIYFSQHFLLKNC
jgi:hypothetical protein